MGRFRITNFRIAKVSILLAGWLLAKRVDAQQAEAPKPPKAPTAQPVNVAPPPPPPWSQQTSDSSMGDDPAETEHESRQDARLSAIEKRQGQDEAGGGEKEDRDKLRWLRGFTLSGYLQPQFIAQFFNSAGSPNATAAGLPPGIEANSVIATSDGGSTNRDYFRLRRARAKLEYEWADIARAALEIEPIAPGPPTAPVYTIVRQADVAATAKWTRDIATEFGIGMFRVPFGYGICERDTDRPFMEHSFVEQNFFPEEFDVGARAYTNLFDKTWGIQFAVLNGQTIGERAFAVVPDLNKGKDFILHLSRRFGFFDVGITGYYGQGSIVDAAALKFKHYPRSAINLDAQMRYEWMPRLGQTRAFGEFTRGTNMDRGVYYAFALPTMPADVHQGTNDLDELGLWLRVEQDLSPLFTAALRYDYYTPDSAQADNGRDTFGAAFVWHVVKGLNLIGEFSHAIDHIHRPGAPVLDRQIETLSAVLQANF